MAAARDRAGGDSQLLGKLATAFSDDFPNADGKLRAALADRNAVAAEMAAHNLRGALLVLSADRAAEAARILELAAGSADWSRARDAYAVLGLEMDALLPELAELA